MIVLEDIDMVSYPFDKQIHKYLMDEYPQGEDAWSEWRESNTAYLGKVLQELDQQSHLKQFLEDEFDVEEGIKEIELKLLEDFGDSSYFLEGVYEGAKRFNHELDLSVIGVTSRACPKEGYELYNNTREKTRTWNDRNDVGLSSVIFRNTLRKSEVLDEVSDDVLCMIEDNPKGLKGFLEKGVPGILIRTHNHYPDMVEEFKERYDMFYVVQDHHEIQNIIAKLR